MEEKKLNRSIAISVTAILLLVAIVAGATYAYFRAVGQSAEQEVTTANLTMGFEAGEWINTTGLMPIDDSQITTGGSAELPFTVTNTGSEHMNITVSLSDITITDGLKDIDFRWGLFNTTTGNAVSRGIFADIGDATEVTLLTNTIIDATESETKNAKNYTLRIWIHDNGTEQDSLMGQNLKAKVKVTGEAVEYTPEECFFSSNGKISEYDVENCPSDVIIPKTIDGNSITEINGMGNTIYSGVITSVIFPETLTKISDFMIASGGKLTLKNNIDIVIPEGVTSIDSYAFEAYSSFSLFLPDTITKLGGFNEDIISNSLVVPSSVTEIGDGAFFNSSIKNIVLNNGLTTINGYAFSNTNLKSIEIPKTVTKIKEYAFDECTQLETIVVRGKDSLDDFDDASGLTDYQDIIEFRP